MPIAAHREALTLAQSALRSAGNELATLSVETRADAIARAARELASATSELGRELRSGLRASAGLSDAVIEHGLRTTLELFETSALVAVYSEHVASVPPSQSQQSARSSQLCVSVLAGNVFSAAARPILLPLLCGHAVLAKASSADDALPRALERALAWADSRLGAACAVTTFAHGDAALEHALLAKADVVSIYGSDATVQTLSEHASASARVLAHGHGHGAVFIAAAALDTEASARAIAAALALDVAAYDQRGCLSPQAVIVEQGGVISPRDFARSLLDALATIEQRLPRGPLPAAAAAAQLQWRGVAAALFDLCATSTAAVSYEHDAALRASPGYRNVSVYTAADSAELHGRLAPFGAHCKALGVADLAGARRLSELAPYVCAVGRMQTPPLTARLDGMHPLEGF